MSKSILSHAAIALTVCTLSACSLSDPTDSASADQNSRISYISWLGAKIISYDYDTEGRLTGLHIASGDDMAEMIVSYSPLTIEMIEYDEGMDYEGNIVKYADERMVIHDCQFNANGYITSFTMLEETTSFNGELGQAITETYPVYCSYNAAGQLRQVSYPNDGDCSTLTWSNGKMTRIDDGDGYYIDVDYSNTKNLHDQWSCMWTCWGMEFITGYFGKAPEYFPSKMTENDNYYATDVQVSYRLNSNGYIQQERLSYDGGSSLETYTYHYTTDNSSANRAAAQAATSKAPEFRKLSHRSLFNKHK